MFSAELDVMLYVKDLQLEHDFWEQLGLVVSPIDTSEMPNFVMKTDAQATQSFVVYPKDEIEKLSPEVAQNQPSILFRTDDIQRLHAHIQQVSSYFVGEIHEQPFVNFAFESPSGRFYAVREV